MKWWRNNWNMYVKLVKEMENINYYWNDVVMYVCLYITCGIIIIIVYRSVLFETNMLKLSLSICYMSLHNMYHSTIYVYVSKHVMYNINTSQQTISACVTAYGVKALSWRGWHGVKVMTWLSTVVCVVCVCVWRNVVIPPVSPRRLRGDVARTAQQARMARQTGAGSKAAARIGDIVDISPLLSISMMLKRVIVTLWIGSCAGRRHSISRQRSACAAWYRVSIFMPWRDVPHLCTHTCTPATCMHAFLYLSYSLASSSSLLQKCSAAYLA